LTEVLPEWAVLLIGLAGVVALPFLVWWVGKLLMLFFLPLFGGGG